MFHRVPDTVADPPTHVDVEPPEPVVPLSHLELDLPAPVEGWATYLADRGISITIDDVGRASVSRSDARQLLTEQREAEVRRREKAAELERQLVERDRQFRASLGRGIPADAIPAGMTYAEAVASAELDGQAYRPRASVVEDLLDNSGGLTFHSIGPAAPVEE
jgi:hypothetical protein